MSACLHMIVAEMCEFLDVAQLRVILLNAIPEQQERDVYYEDPPRREGLPRMAPAGRWIRSKCHEEAYSALFPNWGALDYLDEIRSVVLGVDPERDPGTLEFLLEEFDSYFVKQAPDFFQPILVIFKKWHELSAGNPPSAADAAGRGQPAHHLQPAGRMTSTAQMRALLGRMKALRPSLGMRQEIVDLWRHTYFDSTSCSSSASLCKHASRTETSCRVVCATGRE